MSDRSDGEAADESAPGGDDGDTTAHETPDEGVTPADAFALVGEPTRLAILRAIWAAPEDVVSFSTIREAVGMPDTGRFNYHLGKLQGQFIRKVPGEGYGLRQPGTAVVRAVLAGVLDQAPVREPTPFGPACPDPECDGELAVSYDDVGEVRCGECETVWLYDEFPPAGLTGRDARALAEALDRWNRHRTLLAFDGVCASCASETTRSVTADSGAQEDSEDDGGVLFVERACGHCGYRARAPLWAVVVHGSAVASALDDHGVAVQTRPFWELAELAASASATDDGFRVRVDLDEETLTVTVDEDLEVVATDWS